MKSSILVNDKPAVKATKYVGPTYEEFIANLRMHFERFATTNTLLTVSTHALWTCFLACIPTMKRKTYACRACESFMKRWGGAVVVGPDGAVRSALWSLPESMVPRDLREAVRNVNLEVLGRPVDGGLVSSSRELGLAFGGGFTHMSVLLPKPTWSSNLKTEGQRRAELRERFKDLKHAMDEWSQKVHVAAIDVLRFNGMERHEKFLAHATWLLQCKDLLRGKRNKAYDNLLWKAVVAAPEGWCSPRSQVVGSLLDDLSAGMKLDVVRKRFNDKVEPLAYQRPQAPPKTGTIDRAEKIFETLNLGRSLERRMARVHELERTWRPRQYTNPSKGLFEDLRSTDAPLGQAMMSKPMSWRSFDEDFLQKNLVAAIYVNVPAVSKAFIAFTSAVHEDAEPLLRWDSLEKRNPVAWYFYASASGASHWNLRPTWTECLGIARRPSWGGAHGHGFEDTPTLLLAGMKDLNARHLGLFPEIMRTELHEVRSVIEAHSKTRQLIEGEAGGIIAAGIDVPSCTEQSRLHLRTVLTTGAVVETYIDRLR